VRDHSFEWVTDVAIGEAGEIVLLALPGLMSCAGYVQCNISTIILMITQVVLVDM